MSSRRALPLFDPQRLGAAFDFAQSTATVNATADYVTSANQRRVSIAFNNVGATTLFFAPFQVATLNAGWRLQPNQPPLTFLWADWGPIVGAQWSCIGSGPGGSLTICELVYDR